MHPTPQATRQHQVPQEYRRTIAARPVDATAVHVVVEGTGVGPWSLVTDLPRADREMVGPPPAYLALAGWAA